MKWLRFSIAHVMVVVVYAAIGLSAFRSAGASSYGKTLVEFFFTLTLGLLMVASIMAFFRDGRSRTRWLGFALFGWLHLQYGWPNAGGPAFDVPWRPRFPHTRFISDLFMRLGITFSGSQEQGFQKWVVLQSAITVATALLGVMVGDVLAIMSARRSHDPTGRTSGWLRSLIPGLIAVGLYAALGVTTYRSATPDITTFGTASDAITHARMLDNTYYFVTVAALAFAALASSVREGRSRARWMGFAAFGWLHLEFGWPDSTLNHSGFPWRAEFPHVTLLAKLLREQLSPNTDVYNMFRWHVVQSTLTLATAILGAVVVGFLPIRPGQRGGESPNPSPGP